MITFTLKNGECSRLYSPYKITRLEWNNRIVGFRIKVRRDTFDISVSLLKDLCLSIDDVSELPRLLLVDCGDKLRTVNESENIINVEDSTFNLYLFTQVLEQDFEVKLKYGEENLLKIASNYLDSALVDKYWKANKDKILNSDNQILSLSGYLEACHRRSIKSK